MILHIQTSKKNTAAFVFSALLAFLLLVVTQKVHAAPVVDKIPPGVMPAFAENYLLDCGGTNGAVAQTGWVSLRNQPTVTVIDVNNTTTTTVDLQYNVAGIVCRSSIKGGIVSTTNGIIATNPGSLGISGLSSTYNYGPSNGDYTLGAPIPFTYTSATPFTVSTDINVAINEKRINTYSVNPRYRCVTNPGDVNPRTPASNTDFTACRSSATPFFSIRVNVPPQGNPPRGVVDGANCSVINGWAYDPDRSGDSIAVHVYIDAPAGAAGATMIGEFAANTARPDVNSAFGITGNHGYSIAIPAAYQFSNRTIYVYAIGIDSNGARDGINAYLGTRSYTACTPQPSLSCTIGNIAILAGQSAAVTIVVRHNGPSGAPNSSFSGTLAIATKPSESVNGAVALNSVTSVTGASRQYTATGSFTATASLRGSSAAGGADFSCSGTITVTAPAPTISCDLNASDVDMGSTGYVTLSLHHNGPQYAPNLGFSATYIIDSQPNETRSGSVANGVTTVQDSTARSYPVAGQYNARVAVTATGGGFTVNTSCQTVITVYSRPYIRTYGNDVQAGFGFYSGDTCENGTGDITAYGRDASVSYAGSGGQLGAFARGQIRGFRSANMLSSAATEPTVLSFANSVLVAQATGRYGGNFGTGTCAYNYWSDSTRTTTINNQFIDIGTLAEGKYYVKQADASVPVVVTGSIANGVRLSLYVDGTVFIKGASVGYAATNWTTASTIPSFYLVARGNILIGSDVTSMDGNYIAQNTNAADGRITTCADPVLLALYSTNASQLTSCNKKLVVNGSFTAKHVNFMRLIGTIRQAVPGEAPAATNAAETFVYPLENYLGRQAIGGTYQQTYDSITALPPIL